VIDNPMPPVTNRPLYIYRIFVKLISFFIFGMSTLFLIFILMPLLLLFIHPAEKFSKFTRRMISGYFRFYIQIMQTLGAVKLEVDNAQMFRTLESKIVTANHPSLLDVVMLISLIPNADVIVRGNLSKNLFFAGIVSKLYILNSLDFDEIVSAVKESLNRGNCIIIFPEGTRTPRDGNFRLKKGAARLSLMCGADIVSVNIGGTDKYGLGKNDPLFAFNHRERYIYRIKIQKTLNPEKYSEMETCRAVRRLNSELFELFKKPEIESAHSADTLVTNTDCR